MKNEQGFSLVELLIVVAIIAIIAAIAVPSLLTSRMAANEASGIEGCRTAGTAEVTYASTNNQMYAPIATLVAGKFLDDRYTNGFNGYTYANADVTVSGGVAWTNDATFTSFGIVATGTANMARYNYGIGPDQVVRYQGAINGATAPSGLNAGDGIGAMAAR